MCILLCYCYLWLFVLWQIILFHILLGNNSFRFCIVNYYYFNIYIYLSFIYFMQYEYLRNNFRNHSNGLRVHLYCCFNVTYFVSELVYVNVFSTAFINREWDGEPMWFLVVRVVDSLCSWRIVIFIRLYIYIYILALNNYKQL